MALFFSFVSIIVLGLMAYGGWRTEVVLRKVYWPALLCKLIAAIAVGVIYKYYYTSGDTFLFFQDGATLTEFSKKDFIEYCKFLWNGDETSSLWKSIQGHQPRVLFFSKIVSLVNFFTGSNYWITALYFSFLSFLCSLTFVHTLIRYFPQSKWQAVFSCLFVPSVVFWGSGIVKECLAIASLFFLASVFLKVIKSDRIDFKNWVLVLFFSWILWNIKYYYGALFLIVTFTSIIVEFGTAFLNIKIFGWKLLLWIMVFCVPLYGISFLVENFHRENFFNVIVQNYEAYKHLSTSGGSIEYSNIKPTGWSLIQNAPWALFSGLFRPFVWESQNVLQFLASLENAVLFILILSSLWRRNYNLTSTGCMLVFTTIVYTVLLCTFLALSSPNVGTLSRYRIGFLPFLFFLISCGNPLINRLITFTQRSFFRLVR